MSCARRWKLFYRLIFARYKLINNNNNKNVNFYIPGAYIGYRYYHNFLIIV